MTGQEVRNPDEPFARVDVARAKALIAEGASVLDVREPDEWNEGHISGAKLASLQAFLTDPAKFISGDNIVFACAVGQRSAIACEMAAALGLEKLYNLEGGTNAWRKAGEAITVPSPPLPT